jgi:hypothetical protein
MGGMRQRQTDTESLSFLLPSPPSVPPSTLKILIDTHHLLVCYLPTNPRSCSKLVRTTDFQKTSYDLRAVHVPTTTTTLHQRRYILFGSSNATQHKQHSTSLLSTRAINRRQRMGNSNGKPIVFTDEGKAVVTPFVKTCLQAVDSSSSNLQSILITFAYFAWSARAPLARCAL